MADEDQEHLERIFKRFDTNGDGKISSTELGEALKMLGSVSPEEVQRMMTEIDTDGEGSISYQEYMDFCNANQGLMRDVAKILPIYVFSWNNWVSGKYTTFVWRANEEKIASAMALRNRGINLLDTICKTCGAAEESAVHVLLRCNFAKKNLGVGDELAENTDGKCGRKLD
ncbi:putative EF-hand domain, reverse transcriptase zinc-binding domain-containing protein [Helianthus debilis subsp. tardiflorus]